MSPYDFRHRIRLPNPYLPYTQTELPLRVPGFDQRRIALRAEGDPGVALTESTRPTINGEGFTSHEEACEAGKATRTMLERAFAIAGVAADFGDRASTGSGLDSILQKIGDEQGIRILDDNPQLMVYEHSDIPTVFGSGTAHGYAPSVEEHLNIALHHPGAVIPESRETQIAYSLYSASKFEQMPDTRFLLLMIGIEVLIEPEERGAEDREIVENLIKSAKNMAIDKSLPANARDSLIGSLKSLRKESISSAGRRLVAILGERQYGGMKPQKFFTKCYGVRSKLVHGDILDRPTPESLGSLAAGLELMIRHLIAGPELVEAVFGSNKSSQDTRGSDQT